jgi:Zn-dependent M28 family amino/carboxypeptidase
MKLHALVAALAIVPSIVALAADAPPAVPATPIAERKELLFEDNFETATPAKQWHNVVPTFVIENGVLKGTQKRDKEVPAANGKPAVPPHAAVFGLDVPTKDSVVEVKIKFAGATMVDVEFDDRKFTGSHYGHLCRAQVRLATVTIMDERDGNQNEEIKAMRSDPSKKAEVAARMKGKQATFPLAAKLEQNQWYTLLVETVGDEMRVSIDGKPVGFLKSAGIGHPTKSKIELGVAGKDGLFDDIKVWNAVPSKQ